MLIKTNIKKIDNLICINKKKNRKNIISILYKNI